MKSFRVHAYIFILHHLLTYYKIWLDIYTKTYQMSYIPFIFLKGSWLSSITIFRSKNKLHNLLKGFSLSFYCFEGNIRTENPLEFLLKSSNRAIGDLAYDAEGSSKIGNTHFFICFTKEVWRI